MERGCCEFICGAPTTFQGYGIEQNRIELRSPANVVVLFGHWFPPHGHVSTDSRRFMYLPKCSWYMCAPGNAGSFQVKSIYLSIWV